MPQTITTPGGETLVVLPLAEYERLTDRLDIAAADKVKADIAAGRDELIPEAFAARLVDGESPVRVFRDLRGLSGRKLAEQAGISAAYLSEVESGKKEGSIAVMKKLAEVLNVSIDDLV